MFSRNLFSIIAINRAQMQIKWVEINVKTKKKKKRLQPKVAARALLRPRQRLLRSIQDL